MFSWLSWLKKTNYSREAAQLLQVAQALSATSTVPVLDAYPAIEQLFRRPGFSVEGHWDFFFTCAAAGTGLFLFGQRRQSEIRAFAVALTKQLEGWDRQGVAAMADFQGFVTRNMSAGLDLSTSAGAWIVWNLKGDKPSEEELKAAPAIGSLLVNGVTGWENL